MSRGRLRNMLCNEIALRSEALLLLLEGRDQKRQRHGEDQEMEEGLATFSNSTAGHAHLCPWEWRKYVTRLIDPAADRGENDREGCEISSLLERIVNLAVFIISGVSSHSSSPNLIKVVIFSCPYWYIEKIHFSLMKSNPNPETKHEHKRIEPVPSNVWRITTATKAIAAKTRVEHSTTRMLILEHSARLFRRYCLQHKP